jgi:hypothetical protein
MPPDESRRKIFRRKSGLGWIPGANIMYYHTQNNRRVRRVDLKKIDFTGGTELMWQAMDKEKGRDYLDVSFQK